MSINKWICNAILISASFGFAAVCIAETNGTLASYTTIINLAKADYQTAKDKCDSVSGKENDKEICISEAKLNQIRATAQAAANYDNTSAARSRARVAVADAQYVVDKNKCGNKAAAEKHNCMIEATATHDTTVAESRAVKKVAEALTDAVDAKNKANYRVEIAKCESLIAPDRDGCIDAANAKFIK